MHSVLRFSPCPSGYPPIIVSVLSRHVLTFSIFCVFFDIFDFLCLFPLYFSPCIFFAYFRILYLWCFISLSILDVFACNFGYPPIFIYALSRHVLTFLKFFVFFDIFMIFDHFPLYFCTCIFFLFSSILYLWPRISPSIFHRFCLYFCLPPHFRM